MSPSLELPSDGGAVRHRATSRFLVALMSALLAVAIPAPAVTSAAPTPVTLLTAPGGTIVDVTGAGDGWVSLIWTTLSDGGSPITGYNVYKGTTSGGEGTTPVNATLITDTTATISGLTNRTTYWFIVKAVNAIGEGPASNEVAGTPGPSCEGFWEFYQYYASTPFTCTISPGITSLDYIVVGGPGGNIYAGETITQRGGQGADIRGSLPVTAGETLTITVGASGYLGGYGGAGGGGYSSISRTADDGTLTPVVIAGGGGGAGTGGGGPGGNAGLGGTGGGGAGGSDVHPTGYDGATEPTGGAGGTGSYVGAGGAGGTYDPANPSAANGHAGLYYGDYSRGYGGGGGSAFGGAGSPGGGGAAGTYAGGGGGGYAGGGGGAGLFYRGAGGGGGSSLIPVGATARTPVEGPQVKMYSAPGAPTMGTPVHGVWEVTLSWTPPFSDGGSPILGYNVYEGRTSGGENSTPVNGKTLITGASTTVTGLTNGTTYYFTVAAVTGHGEGPVSNEVSDTPLTREPDAPLMHKTDAAAGQVTLSWDAPAFDGGEAITGYNVYRGTTRGGEETTPANATLITGTTTTVTGLTNGTTYWFTVKAVNAVGVGAASNEVSAVAGPRYLYFRSGAGTIGRRELGGGNSIVNNFITGLGSDAPYGVTVDGQHVYWTVGATDYDSTSGWIGRANLDGTDVVNHWVPTGGSDWIAVDDDYIYWANSYNGIGCADATAWGSIGRAKLDGSEVTQCWIRTWDYDTGTGGFNPQGVAVDSSYIYFSVEWSRPGDDPPALMRAHIDGTHVERIALIGGGQPEGVAVDADHVFWAKACANHAIGQGTLGRSDLDGSNANATFFPSMPCPIGVAVNGPDLYFTNWATNQIGRLPTDRSSTTPTWLSGSISDWGIAIGPAAGLSGPTVPGAPVLGTPASGDGSVTLQWTAPASDGGATITGYNVYQGTSAGHESATPLNASLITGTTLTIDGLPDGTTYWFTVRAVNSAGESPASNEVSGSTLLASTLAITGPTSGAYGHSYPITVSGSSGTGALTFDAGGSTACSIQGSNVVITLSSGTCTITATRASDGTWLHSTSDPFAVTVEKAPLTVTADNKTINYGEATPTFSVSYSGFAAGETATDLSGTLVYTFTGIGVSPYGPSTTPPTEAGNYWVTPSGLSGDDYTVTFVRGTFKILPTETFTTSIAWNGDQPSVAYVGSPVTFTGLLSPAPPAANMTAQLRFYSVAACNTMYGVKDTKSIATNGTVSLDYTPSAGEVGAASVRIYFGGGFSNGARYNGSYTSCQELTVSAALVPTAISAVSGSGTYGGTASLTATLKAGDTALSGKSIAFTLNGADAGSATTDENGVATLADISLGSITGGAHTDYVGASFAGGDGHAPSGPTTGDLTVARADQASLSITGPTTAGYGDTDATISYTGGSGTGTVTFSAGTSSACSIVSNKLHVTSGTGTCSITATKAADTNFKEALSAAHPVTIGKAPLTVTADAVPATEAIDHFTKPYGQPLPAFTARYAGFVNGDDAADLGGTLGFYTTAIQSSAVGAYDVTPKGLTSSNYLITFRAGVLDIGKADQASLSITGPGSATYGHADYDITPSGGSGTGAVTFDAGTSSACSIVSNKLHVTSGTGTCSITATKAADTNYESLTSAAWPVTIQKADQTIAFTSTVPSTPVYGGHYTVSAIGGGSGNQVTFSIASGSSTLCSVTGSEVSFIGVGSCVIQANQAGNSNYNAAIQQTQSFTVGTAVGYVAYIGQTLVVTAGPNTTTAQVMLSASVVGAAGDITKARVTFVDDVSHAVLAKGVKVSPVAGSTVPTGTASAIVSLSAGKYGAQSYLIRVVLDVGSGSPYENTEQLGDPTSSAYATVTVIVPGGTNTAKGDADLEPAAPAGTYAAGTHIHYTIGLKYNKGGSSPQGQALVSFDLGGYRYYIKSNSISSIACTVTANPCRDLTVYTKASIYRVDGTGQTTSVDGNVTLRLDLHDQGGTATGDAIGITILSSKNSSLYFSNNWMFDPTAKAWRTLQQPVSTAGGMAVQVN